MRRKYDLRKPDKDHNLTLILLFPYVINERSFPELFFVKLWTCTTFSNLNFEPLQFQYTFQITSV